MQTVAFDRLAMLACRFGIGDLGLRISKSQITNPESEIELKGWRLNRFAYVLEMRVKRFELLHSFFVGRESEETIGSAVFGKR